MWYVTNQHADAVGTWVLCRDGEVKETFGSSHNDRARATAALVRAQRERWALIAAADPGDEFVAWTSDAIAFVGVPTSDRRVIDSVGGFRSFPLPLMSQIETDFGHNGAVIVGRIDSATVSGSSVPATGVIDVTTERGAYAARLVETGQISGVSVDLMSMSVTTEVVEEDENGMVVDWLDHFADVEVGGLTLTPFPAFADARMRLAVTSSVTAAAFPVEPPVEWFADPQLQGRTRLTVLDDGRVFGHLAPWGECHVGVANQCVQAPRSLSNYGWFTLGTMRCEEGCEIPIGVITMDTGHADRSLRARAAASHYDNTGTAIADVAVGEDEHGIWFAGAIRPAATPEQVRALRASKLSGDWRGVNGSLELVAVLAVNTPGFPVYEESVAADGSMQTVTASLMAEAPSPAATALLRDLSRKLGARVHSTQVEKLTRRVHLST